MPEDVIDRCEADGLLTSSRQALLNGGCLTAERKLRFHERPEPPQPGHNRLAVKSLSACRVVTPLYFLPLSWGSPSFPIPSPPPACLHLA